MASAILPFPLTESHSKNKGLRRDFWRRLPANVIDLVRVRGCLPGDTERDVDECRRTLLNKVKDNLNAVGSNRITGLVMCVQRGNRWRVSWSGSYRYDLESLAQTLDEAATLVAHYAGRSFVERAINEAGAMKSAMAAFNANR